MAETYTYAILFLFVAVLAITLLNLHTERRMNKLLRGKSENLEKTIDELHKDVEKLIAFRKEIEKYLRSVETRLQKSVQGTSVIRYNAFEGNGTGGNQSFATAFINEKGDGLVISGLHSRDSVGVYAKPIVNKTSSYELSGEEKEAVKLATPSKVS